MRRSMIVLALLMFVGAGTVLAQPSRGEGAPGRRKSARREIGRTSEIEELREEIKTLRRKLAKLEGMRGDAKAGPSRRRPPRAKGRGGRRSESRRGRIMDRGQFGGDRT